MTRDDARLSGGRDPHGVREVLRGFPAQYRRALSLGADPPLRLQRPALVVIAGMGGSAAGGDLVAACAVERLDVPVVVHRGYGLPRAAGRGALVVAASYSGETAEVLSAVETALERAVPVATVSAGGSLARLGASRRLPHVPLPPGLAPRLALGYLFVGTARLLAEAGLAVATDAELAEGVGVLETLAAALDPRVPVPANEAKRLALALSGRLPAIYGGPGTGAVAYRWKTDLEENAKMLAVAGVVPEVNHNEIEAWRAPEARALQLLFLREADEPPEIARRFTVMRELVAATAGGVSECWARGAGRAARQLALAYVGMWTSYYLAALRDADPWAVPWLDEMKRRLASDPKAARGGVPADLETR